jgi:putative transposase
MDVIVVDAVHRRPIGRPWITIVFDVATRVVLGFHATLEAPSATSVAMALSMACLPKTRWLKSLNLDLDWAMHGLPEVLHVDNGREFHSEALRRGCERHGIRLAYRPPGRPYTGGHIERYLGTLMRRIHGVPGTTMSNIEERGNYDSAKRSALTLPELEEWLTIESAGRYHEAVNRGIHLSPRAAWRRAVRDRVLRMPQRPDDLAIDFLPVASRNISRAGFQLFHIRYWDPLLTRIFAVPQRLFVRYDPRNLAHVYVPVPGRGDYLTVPYADLRRPPISQYEQEAVMRELRARGRQSANEDTIFAAIELQRKLVDRAQAKTRARRQVARRPAAAPARPTRNAQSGAGSPVDYAQPAKPYHGETWS